MFNAGYFILWISKRANEMFGYIFNNGHSNKMHIVETTSVGFVRNVGQKFPQRKLFDDTAFINVYKSGFNELNLFT